VWDDVVDNGCRCRSALALTHDAQRMSSKEALTPHLPPITVEPAHYAALTFSRSLHNNSRATSLARTASVSIITERKRAQEQQKLLVKEMKHRIKNSLATVQAIATQTLN
jgi:hypothetical protein